MAYQTEDPSHHHPPESVSINGLTGSSLFAHSDIPRHQRRSIKSISSIAYKQFIIQRSPVVIIELILRLLLRRFVALQYTNTTSSSVICRVSTWMTRRDPSIVIVHK